MEHQTSNGSTSSTGNISHIRNNESTRRQPKALRPWSEAQRLLDYHEITQRDIVETSEVPLATVNRALSLRSFRTVQFGNVVRVRMAVEELLLQADNSINIVELWDDFNHIMEEEYGMRLLGYTRVSEDDQANKGHSLELVQPALLQNHCDKEGHDLFDVLVDVREIKSKRRGGKTKLRAVSADIPLDKRPQGRFVKDIILQNNLDGILVPRLDRLFRLGVDAIVVGDWFRRNGLHIVSIQNPIDIHTRHGWFAFGIMALSDEYDRGKIVDRAVEVSSSLKASSMAWSRAPYGCVIEEEKQGDRVIKRLFRETDTWVVRLAIVRMKEEQGMSLRAICDRLKSKGIPAPAGGKLWHVSTVRGILETHHELEHIPALPDSPEASISMVAGGRS